MHLRVGLLCALAAFSTATTIWADGSGLNVAVIVNQNSTNSIQLANAYCEQRGVPPQNVLRLTHQWSGFSVSSYTNEFHDDLLAPLLNMIQSRNLTNQIQYVLLSMDLPYIVSDSNNDYNSTSSALFYGYKPNGPPPGPGLPASCSLPDNSSNSYALSELPFYEATPNTASTNSFLAVMLTDTSLAGAESILSRGVASDSTFPTQPVYLAKTSDPARNVRYTEFDNAIFDTRVHGEVPVSRTNTDSTDFTDLFGLETGQQTFSLPTNAFVPGALADNLTSFGGYLFQNAGQTVLLAFLDAGAAGSYGTVTEPCNWPQKFPNPINYFYQARGFSLAESYYQSIQNPFQGIMVGEPLSAPFARRGTGSWALPAGTPMLTGQTNLHLSFSAADTDLPINQVDLFVDGTWFQTVTNLPPNQGDALSVTLNGVTNSYTVPPNSTIASVAAGLVSVIDSNYSSTLVWATAWGDRIELQSVNPSLPGADVTLSANATSQTTTLTPARASFLDSIATGYHTEAIQGTPAVGDWLRLSLTLTNGSTIMLGVTNTSGGETIGQLMSALYNDVNNTGVLQASGGVYGADFDDESSSGYADFNLYAQFAGWPASAIETVLTASPDFVFLTSGTNSLQDNLSDLVPRNHLYVAAGKLSLPVNWTMDTAVLPDGYHELEAVAYEGTSVRTQTRVSQNVIIQNTGLSAVLNTLYGGSNTDLGATLQFSVVANTENVSTIELFSTGGLLQSATNQPSANFSVTGAALGLGLHPFYAIVTDNTGHQYRTATTWIRLIGPEPPITLSGSAVPPVTLQWSATAGRPYEILTGTNVFGITNVIATVTPSNSMAAWVDTNSSGPAQFFRVQSSY